MTSPARPLRVLIVDDEPLGRQRLEDLLARQPAAEIAGHAADGRAAVEAIRALAPDLVLLDVQMPGMTGFDVVREIGPDAMPPTIFVTAYDQHAVRAFDVAAVDYLVKPFDDERFEQAFERARRALELRRIGALSEQLRMLLAEGTPSAPQATGSPPVPSPSGARPEYLERIAVEMRGQVRVVPVKQIDYIVASGPYAEIHAGEKRYLIRERMQLLEERLDPAKFIRIHRSAIVRLELIETLLKSQGGDYAVRLRGGVELKVSRSRIEDLEARMGIRR